MEINVHIASTGLKDYNAEKNYELKHGLRAARLAELLDIDQKNKPTASPVLQSLLGNKVFVISGPSEYGGAIKGHAFLGYLEYHSASRLEELELFNLTNQNEAKRKFLLAHGIDNAEIDDDLLVQIDLMHVAVWESFKGRAIIAPTSGSFGIAAYETIEKLRQAEISLIVKGMPRKINFFAANEGRARAWAPDIRTGVMSEEKLEVLKAAAKRTDLEVCYWTERTTRDHYALLDALFHDEYFCPTNPKSREEVAALLKEILSNSFDGKPIFQIHGAYNSLREQLIARIKDCDRQTIKTLERHGIYYNYDRENGVTLSVAEPIAAGIYGLMIPRFRHLDVLANNHIANDTVFQQCSVGATLAGLLLTDSAMTNLVLDSENKLNITSQNWQLLNELFPSLAAAIQRKGLPCLNAYAAPDVANVTLPQMLGCEGITQPNTEGAENGLGTITPGYGPIEAIQNAPGHGLIKTYTAVTKPWFPIGQALLFTHGMNVDGTKAKLPESAGAAALGSYLKFLYDTDQKNGSDSLPIELLVFVLRTNGLSKELFEKILGLKCKDENPWTYVETQAAIHGGNEPKLVADLKKFFSMDYDELRKLPANLTPVPVDDTNSVSFYNTGNNGTDRLKEHLVAKVGSFHKSVHAGMAEAGYHYLQNSKSPNMVAAVQQGCVSFLAA